MTSSTSSFSKLNTSGSPSSKHIFWLVLVAALGYFVDIYDLVLFSIIRIKSLQGIGITDQTALKNQGLMLLNLQMAGMLLGGFLWGVVADKKGRLSVLFGSILLYSLANILNGLARDIVSFGVLRFAAGLGLAGELGAGITLVTESMSRQNRGYGTMIVAGVGVLGAAAAALIGARFSWQYSFFIGGGLGILLLLMRIGVMESSMFKNAKNEKIKMGSLMQLFSSWKNVRKYICCAGIALPFWFMVGILITLGPEFGKALHVSGPVDAGRGIFFNYIGIAVGDMLTGLLSQLLKSRKKVVALFLGLTLIAFFCYVHGDRISLGQYYLLCFLMGVSMGFWVIIVTIGAEQFGTNLRGTVATSVPNLVRGSLIPISAIFTVISRYQGILHSALIVGSATVVIAWLALSQLSETFGKDLDYIDE